MEGNGKYINENGDYYIGPFLNDKYHGKGKEYYKNGSLKYEGEYINDKKEGIGRFIMEDGH